MYGYEVKNDENSLNNSFSAFTFSSCEIGVVEYSYGIVKWKKLKYTLLGVVSMNFHEFLYSYEAKNDEELKQLD
jgi:hypothetical protein